MKRAILLAVAFFVALAIFGSMQKQTKEISPPSAEKKEEDPQFVKNLLELHNKERERRGYKPLQLDNRLCDYAQKHAEKMAKENNLYHSSMSDIKKVNDSGYVGENIAWGQKTEAEVVSAWMWSPGHRWNILGSSYEKVGFGMKKDEDERSYWCVVFTD
jgi:uncharacterized protein YkwD